ncbi:MAG TPA: SAV_6107 family HEPN domain-containing protein [Mycobacteriales bacterium]|nr:SAV_6107 family HEPN domain-containing protein [Mycobacteriales bacterium]
MTVRTLTTHGAGLPARRPVRHRAAPESLRLVHTAHQLLAEAAAASSPLERYAGAHLAALRAAAAVLAARTEPAAGGRRRRPTSAWLLLPDVAPQLRPWADAFAAGAGRRAAAEAGQRDAVTAAQADRLVADVRAFIAVVETTLGMPAPLEPYGPPASVASTRS